MSGRLVLASGNEGKIREFRQMLEPIGFDIVPQRDLGIADADEPHMTFVENALAKARHASRCAGLPAFADDSGICVRALGGAPGVHSARYAAGEGLDRARQDARNNEKLVQAMAAQHDRRAHYYCAIVLVRHADDPEPIITEGRWFGEIARSPRGTSGFGYDPYFWLPEIEQTVAEIDPQTKNALSHRGRALRELVTRLQQLDV